MRPAPPRTSRWPALLLAALVSLGALPAAEAHSADTLPTQTKGHGLDSDILFWNVVGGFSAKSGYRLVFFWDSDAPMVPQIVYGFSPNVLDQVAFPLVAEPDTAGMAVVDLDPAGVSADDTVYFRVFDPTGTNPVSPLTNFTMGNAWTSEPGMENVYTVDLLVQLDTNEVADPGGTPELSLQDAADAIDVFAERVWDMTDGYVRIGRVLLTDTSLNQPNNLPSPVLQDPTGAAGGVLPPPASTPCLSAASSGAVPPTFGTPAGTVQLEHTPADVVIQATTPFDSHTWRAGTPVIDDPCTAIYIGRFGPTGTTGETWDSPLQFAYLLAHEFGHYAMGLADLYGAGGDCSEGIDGDPGGPNWDISVMHNAGGWTGDRWVQSELDRASTPCTRSDPTEVSWDLLVQNYPTIPARGRFGDDLPVHSDSDFEKPSGNPDGGALDLYVLDRTPGVSSVAHLIKAIPPLPNLGGVTTTPKVSFTSLEDGDVVRQTELLVTGKVDRLFQVPEIRVDLFGPYVGDNETPVLLTPRIEGGSADPGDPDPYTCTWSTIHDGVFSTLGDPCESMNVLFGTQGLKTVRLTVLDNGDKKTVGFDTALVNILPPIDVPTGCGGQLGVRVGIDPPADSATTEAKATELRCLGAESTGTDLTLQLEVINKASSPGDPLTSLPPDVYYVFHFTPDFGTYNGQQQSIRVTWSGGTTPLSACWLTSPASANTCDAARTAPGAEWDDNTLLVKFPIVALGIPLEGSQLTGVHALSWHHDYPETVGGLQVAAGPPTRIDDDFVPDARNGVITFDAFGGITASAGTTVCVDDSAPSQTEVKDLDLMRLCASQDDTRITVTLKVADLVTDEALQGRDSVVSYAFFFNKLPSNNGLPPNHYAVTHANTPAPQIWAFPQNAQVPNSAGGPFYAAYDYVTDTITFRILLSMLTGPGPHQVAAASELGEGIVWTGGYKDNLQAGFPVGNPAGALIPYQDLLPNTGLITVPPPASPGDPEGPGGPASGPPGGSGGSGGSGGLWGDGGEQPAFGSPSDPDVTDGANDGTVCRNSPVPISVGACPAADVRAMWVARETETTFDVVLKVQDLETAPPGVYADPAAGTPASGTVRRAAVYIGYIFGFCIQKPVLGTNVCYGTWLRAPTPLEDGYTVTTVGPQAGTTTCGNGEVIGMYVSGNPILDVDTDTIRVIYNKAGFDITNVPANCASKSHNGIPIFDNDILNSLTATSGYAAYSPVAAPPNPVCPSGCSGIQFTEDTIPPGSSRPYRFGQSGLKAEAGGPYDGEPGEEITIEGSAIRSIGPYTCLWAAAILTFNFTSEDSCAGTVVCPLPGVYPLMLTVTDQGGQVAFDETIVRCGVVEDEFVILLKDGKPVGQLFVLNTSLLKPVETWSVPMVLTDKDNGYHNLTVIWFDNFGFETLDRATINITVSLPRLTDSKTPSPLPLPEDGMNSAVAGLDSDGDGAKDGVDNCVFTANAGQEDLDADGVGDVCDLDLDGDGWDNVRDNCADVADPEQVDSDGDRFGDVCDGDDDNDLVADGNDNCRVVGNALQVDLDLDGLGDACDGDDDNDGVLDLFDAFGRDSSEWSDFDGDGVGDEEDADDDGDGIGDGEESVRDRFNAASSLGADERDASALEAPSRDTPALGAWAVLAALAVALLLARRRA